MSAFFVTATGTDIGKTFVTAGLIRHLRRLGHKVDAFKPVLSGFEMDGVKASDAGQLLAALEQDVTLETLDRMAPWRFTAPLSPDIAAAHERRSIDFQDLVRACLV
jgi:dethiobiotin synthetase